MALKHLEVGEETLIGNFDSQMIVAQNSYKNFVPLTLFPLILRCSTRLTRLGTSGGIDNR